MKISPVKITIKDLTYLYADNSEGGVVGYGGRLDIRPPYQREFVYKDKQRDAVIDTIIKNYPLNVMYWAVREDGNFEVIDGQQRTISISQFVNGDFSFMGRYFHNLKDDEKHAILNYELSIYQCSGSDSEKLAWFKTINIAGEKLTDQELRNAVYSGSWVSAAKPLFSKNNCPAYLLGGDYMSGSPIRQDYLETVISWISEENIELYMAKHQHDVDANIEWQYFQSVIAWVKSTFPKYRNEMKGVSWGELFNKHKDSAQKVEEIEKLVTKLMVDEDITNKKGIYNFVLSKEEKHLSIRSFSENQKREAYERQKGICTRCSKNFEIGEMEADHITPWSKGGRTIGENCQMLCKEDNRRKSSV